jgi:catechol 2,3-dioxygenase-like lactoylglutathione lyase family enzyme
VEELIMRRLEHLKNERVNCYEWAMIDAIDHFVLTVADLETTLSFYERALGMTRRITPEKPASLHFGNHKINVHQADRTFEPKAMHPTQGAGDFCLVTPWSLEEVRARLESLGIAIEKGPVARQGARGAMQSLYFRDPDGNLVEVSRYD